MGAMRQLKSVLLTTEKVVWHFAKAALSLRRRIDKNQPLVLRSAERSAKNAAESVPSRCLLKCATGSDLVKYICVKSAPGTV